MHYIFRLKPSSDFLAAFLKENFLQPQICWLLLLLMMLMMILVYNPVVVILLYHIQFYKLQPILQKKLEN